MQTLRLNYSQISPDLFKKFTECSILAKRGSVDKSIVALVEIRASQINGCAFCVDMHVKEARLQGEQELRLHHLSTWHESQLFNEKERAALAWTDALTTLDSGDVSDVLYMHINKHFSEKEVADLTFIVMLVNAWNRAGLAFKSVPGSADKMFGLDRINLAA